MKKLLAMVLAAAMMLSLCVFPVGAAVPTADTVEWTWAKKDDAGVKGTFYVPETTTEKKYDNPKPKYNGTEYSSGAKINSNGSIVITVPEGNWKLLVAYSEATPGTAQLKLTPKSGEAFSGKGTISSISGDTAYVYTVTLTEGTWTLTREGSKEFWIAYMSLSPVGPTVTPEMPSVNFVPGKDGAETSTVEVTVEGYSSGTFFAVSGDTSKVTVTPEKLVKAADVNGTYSLKFNVLFLPLRQKRQ